MHLSDPGYMEVGSNLNTDFEKDDWTHFAPVPRLTHDDVAALKAVQHAS